MEYVPDKGRIIIVNFEKGGAFIPPEMMKSQRPCIVIQNNKLARGKLVTVVPISTTPPQVQGSHHHLMDHRSFKDWPLEWDGQGTPRWAKCDYVTTVSLDRCHDPYRADRNGRRYVKVKAIKADMEAIERCLLWALGIDPQKYLPQDKDLEKDKDKP